MLKSIFIQNYALIETLNLDFNTGLNVITGETGAGKSIIIGALGLVLGNRADASILNKNTAKCIVEATFEGKSDNLKGFLTTNDLDIEDELKIRREINSLGKSRAFINDTPVGLSILKELSTLIIDINNQNQAYIFKSSNIQLEMLDSLIANNSQLDEYKKCFSQYNKIAKKLHQLVENEIEASKTKDFIQFQFEELLKANLTANEEDNIKNELKLIDNAELIKQSVLSTIYTLTESDENIITKLETLNSTLNPLKQLHNNFEELQKRLNSCTIELQDIVNEYININENTEFDLERHLFLKERLDLIIKLQQKHKKQTVEELIILQSDLDDKIQNFSTLTIEIQNLEKELLIVKTELQNLANKLSINRKNGILNIEEKVTKVLQELGMKDAVFQININTVNDFTATGTDEINFLFSSNKGRQADLISKIASGGELSRLVLTLKSLLSNNKNLPTIIFDEIDTGVSGDIASKVGERMKFMSENMQVIAISHLPQIAAKAEYHYKVYKEEINNTTQSNIVILNEEERIREIALMLSGNSNSENALKMAKELLEIK